MSCGGARYEYHTMHGNKEIQMSFVMYAIMNDQHITNVDIQEHFHFILRSL